MESMKTTVIPSIVLIANGIRALEIEAEYLFVAFEEIQQVVMWQENLCLDPSQPA